MKILIYLLFFAFLPNSNQKPIVINIKQDSEIMIGNKNKYKLQKKPFSFEYYFPVNDGYRITYVATVNRKFYKKCKKSSSIKHLLDEKYYPYAFDLNNQGNYLVVGERGYNLLLSPEIENINLFKKSEKQGNFIRCLFDVKEFFLDSIPDYKPTSIRIKDLETSKLYFYFEILNSDNQVVDRKSFIIKFVE